MLLLNRRGVTALTPYLLLGVALWVFMLKSGVHATLAGVATGLMIPHVNRRNEAFDLSAADAVEHSPLEYLEQALHPWVAYAILPLFAFANAGLVLGGLRLQDMAKNSLTQAAKITRDELARLIGSLPPRCSHHD